MNGESGSITWFKEDPFPDLRKRDLLLAVSNGVVGGKPTFDKMAEMLDLSAEATQVAIHDVMRAREDASRVLQRIEGYLKS